MQSRAAAHLARGERDADERQDEGREGVGVARVALDLDDVDRVGALGALLVEEFVELGDVHGLDQVVDLAQFGHLEGDERVEVAELFEGLHAQRVELALGVARGRPAFGLGVEPYVGGFERMGHRTAVVMLQREDRRLWRRAVVAADVGERAGFDLAGDVAETGRLELYPLLYVCGPGYRG